LVEIGQFPNLAKLLKFTTTSYATGLGTSTAQRSSIKFYQVLVLLVGPYSNSEYQVIPGNI
jgi:hypothetical protein